MAQSVGNEENEAREGEIFIVRETSSKKIPTWKLARYRLSLTGLKITKFFKIFYESKRINRKVTLFNSRELIFNPNCS